MRKPGFVVAGVLCGLLVPALAQAETAVRREFDKQGIYEGRSERDGNTTRFYDKEGRTTGRAEVDASGRERVYDKEGRLRYEVR